MNILLVGINFGNYEKKIKNELEKQGHTVYYMFDAHPKQNAVRRVFGDGITHKLNIYYQDKKIRKHDTALDLIIIIVGRELAPEFLNNLKKKNPKAQFVLYLWDDVQRVANYKTTHMYYDRIYSFDLKDCKEFGFIHLPLFFTERPRGNTEKIYDLYSAMFSHSEREQITKRIAEQAVEQGKKCQFYISLGFFAYWKRQKELRKQKSGPIHYIPSPIPEEQNYQNMESSHTILDVQFAGQNGLTMRTIESLGMQNKLITTNPNIRYYDFYDEQNICIIDRKNPVLNPAFLNRPYRPVDPMIYGKYSLETWVKTITGQVEANNYIGNYTLETVNI